MIRLINLVIFVALGTIVTARKFDRERQREYAVTLTATDQAADPLIGICQLTIHILDQNDNNPKFENIRYECKKMVHVVPIIYYYILIIPYYWMDSCRKNKYLSFTWHK